MTPLSGSLAFGQPVRPDGVPDHPARPQEPPLNRTAYLLLEDGRRFDGALLGSTEVAFGEVVFNTSMTGYQGS